MRRILGQGCLWLTGTAVPCAAGEDVRAGRMDAIRATPAERRWRNVPLESSFVVAPAKGVDPDTLPARATAQEHKNVPPEHYGSRQPYAVAIELVDPPRSK